MKRQVVRLTESDLHRIVENSVRRALNESDLDEGWRDYVSGAWDKLTGDASSAAKRGYESGMNKVSDMGKAVRTGMNNAGNAVRQKASDMGKAVRTGMNNVKGYADSVRQAGEMASTRGDIQKCINTIQGFVNNRYIDKGTGTRVINALNNYLENGLGNKDFNPSAKKKVNKKTKEDPRQLSLPFDNGEQ